MTKGGRHDAVANVAQSPVRLLQAVNLAGQTVESSVGTMRYDLLVGADGVGSLVRESLVAQVRICVCAMS